MFEKPGEYGPDATFIVVTSPSAPLAVSLPAPEVISVVTSPPVIAAPVKAVNDFWEI
jgi:hypothetical protein